MAQVLASAIGTPATEQSTSTTAKPRMLATFPRRFAYGVDTPRSEKEQIPTPDVAEPSSLRAVIGSFISGRVTQVEHARQPRPGQASTLGVDKWVRTGADGSRCARFVD
jgi:hypothetical protein